MSYFLGINVGCGRQASNQVTLPSRFICLISHTALTTCRQGSGHERRLHCQKHEQNADRSHESGDSPPPWKKWYCGMVKFVRMRWIVFHSSVSSTELEMQLLWSRAVRRKISGARIWHHGRPLSSLRIYCSTHAHQILAARKPLIIFFGHLGEEVKFGFAKSGAFSFLNASGVRSSNAMNDTKSIESTQPPSEEGETSIYAPASAQLFSCLFISQLALSCSNLAGASQNQIKFAS